MKYFTISELTRTNTGLFNIPNRAQEACLMQLVTTVLDPAREEYGRPVFISSGYRSQAVNKTVGGVPTSQHTKGEAADLKAEDLAGLFDIIKAQGNFDQLIWEFGDEKQPQWIHVSHKRLGNRKEVLRAVKRDGKTIYLKF